MSLASWDGLLQALGAPAPQVDLPQLLRWELMLVSDAPPRPPAKFKVRERIYQWANIPAKKRELELHRRVARLVEASEGTLFHSGFGLLDDVKRILRSPRLFDVVSLNVDLTLERLLLNKASLIPAPEARPLPIDRFRRLPRIGMTPLRVWHPHGDRLALNSMAFGLHRYSKLVRVVEEARRRMKADEKHRNSPGAAVVKASDGGLVDLLTQHPIIFAGTSLNQSEWDLWLMLVGRWRNFAKHANRRSEEPCWILTVPGQHQTLPELRIGRLEGRNWNEAWHFLADVLSPRRTRSASGGQRS